MSGKFAVVFLVLTDRLVVLTSTVVGEDSLYRYYSLLRSQISLQQSDNPPRTYIPSVVH